MSSSSVKLLLISYLNCSGCLDIFDGADILIGRDPKSWYACWLSQNISTNLNSQIVRSNPSISNRHLRIYSVIYEANIEPIQGFVYAEDLSTNGSFWQYKRGSHLTESLIGRCNAVLLSSGDQVRFCFTALPSASRLYLLWDQGNIAGTQIIPRTRSKWSVTIEAHRGNADRWQAFTNLYTLTDRKLGDGAFGKVVMAVDCFRQRQMACKIVNLKNPALMRAQQCDFAKKLRCEVDILKDLSHVRLILQSLRNCFSSWHAQPNIIHVERCFYTENTL